LLVGLLSRQQGNIIDRAVVILLLNQVEASLRRVDGVVFGLERLRVIVERRQRVGDVLERL